GGVIGHSIHKTISIGMSRAVYSSEAGWGTSAMIHSTERTKHPVEQGLLGVLEVFFDTIIICSITGIVVVIGLLSGIEPTTTLVIDSFSLGIGPLAQLIIPITIFLFGLTTSIGWYSYYESIILYFSLRSKFKFDKKFILKIIKCIYPLPGLVIVIMVKRGGGVSGALWDFADILAGLPTFINIFAILLLSDKFFELLKDYEQKFIKKEVPEEEIPLFYSEEEQDYYKF
ncbi:MAG: alanine:cation symporter family protein, partial [Clostridium sp.]